MMSIWLYAGIPENLAVLERMKNTISENPTSAGNQQERLIKLGWVIGFVDGEGCFSIGFVRQPDRKNRKGYRNRYQVSHDFAVVPGARSGHVLHALRGFFGVGSVYMNTRHDNHRENMYLYSVCRRSHLLDVIIPFFK